MDFLDSLGELERPIKKADRVRSWYLYEQFKSLEKNQLEAAQKLKGRSYQDRILRQELSERRVRRSICDQFGLCQSNSNLENSIKDSRRSDLTVSADDFFESVSELQEDGDESAHENILSEDTFSQDDSIDGKSYIEEFKTVQGIRNDRCAENVPVQENLNDSILSDDLRNVLKTETDIAQNIHWQLEEVKENINFIEKCTKLADDTASETSSAIATEKLQPRHVVPYPKSVKQHNNLLLMWTRLVSFAYRVMRVNHGNCYYDYGSQFLTAVLACDVLRKGVSRMCHILQPFVSPIKYTADESDGSVKSSCRSFNRKKSILSKKDEKPFGKKVQAHCRFKFSKTKHPRVHRKYRSEECWPQYSDSPRFNRKCRRANVPWRGIPKCQKREAREKSSSSSIWPEFLKEDVRNSHVKNCNYCWRKEIKHSMSRIAWYINGMLRELEEFNRK